MFFCANTDFLAPSERSARSIDLCRNDPVAVGVDVPVEAEDEGFESVDRRCESLRRRCSSRSFLRFSASLESSSSFAFGFEFALEGWAGCGVESEGSFEDCHLN